MKSTSTQNSTVVHRAAYVYVFGLRLLGALGPLSLFALIVLGAYLNLRDIVSIVFTLITAGHDELSGGAQLAIGIAAILAALLVSVYLLRHCTRWHRRYARIGERKDFDPQTRIATTYEFEQGYIDLAYFLTEVGLAILGTALIANAFWGDIVARVYCALGVVLTVTGIVLLVRAVQQGTPKYSYYPTTPEFIDLAAQYVIGTEDRDHLIAELAKIPPSNIDYPMARKMIESCETGAELDVTTFTFGAPPGEHLPPPPQEPAERIG